MKEDKLTNAIIEHFKSRENTEPKHDKVIVEPEAHYNHYGTRGVADLFVRDYESSSRAPTDMIFEIKSNPQNANEVIRQYNKMANTFYKDRSRSMVDKVLFELCFTPEEDNLHHIVENASMYASINGKVTMRHPDNVKPVILTVLIDQNREYNSFLSFAESTNEEIYQIAQDWDIPEKLKNGKEGKDFE